MTRGLARTGPREAARLAAGLVLACALPCAPPAAAQVMEIDAGGQVRTYDRPSTFDASGATPIASATTAAPPSRRRSTRGAAAADAAPPLATLEAAAGGAELSPELVSAVAWRESRYRSRLVSRAGAVGEMQLMPATARDLGVDPYDSGQNYRGGAAYLGGLMRRYDGDLMRALAAYNAGPGAVDRYGGMPPYRETRAYVSAILDRLSRQAADPRDQDAMRDLKGR